MGYNETLRLYGRGEWLRKISRDQARHPGVSPGGSPEFLPEFLGAVRAEIFQGS